MGPVLGKRDARLIVAAVGISAVGDFLLWVPLTLHLQATTGSGLAVAALLFALWAPVVVLAPVAGLIVDRLEARAVLIAASLAQAVVAAGLISRSTRPRRSCRSPSFWASASRSRSPRSSRSCR